MIHDIGGHHLTDQLHDGAGVEVGHRIGDGIGYQVQHVQLVGFDFLQGLLQQTIKQVTGTGGTDEIAVNASEPGIHQGLDAVQVLYAGLLFQLIPFAVFVVIGIGDGFAVGNLFTLGVFDGSGGQVGVNGGGFRLGQVDINAAERFDDLRDAVEVDGDIMLDVQLKIVIDCADAGFRRIGPGLEFAV